MWSTFLLYCNNQILHDYQKNSMMCIDQVFEKSLKHVMQQKRQHHIHLGWYIFGDAIPSSCVRLHIITDDASLLPVFCTITYCYEYSR